VTRPRLPFLTLTLGEDAAAVRAAIDRVVASGWFVLGPEVERFESAFAQAAGASHAIGVGNGTDALMLVLRALGIGPGDEVITSPLSAAYTALAIVMVGATPIFADIDATRLTLDPERIAEAIGPRTRAVLPVHLYGQSADMTAIKPLAAKHHLAIVEDCCQAHLATSGGRPVGTFGAAGAFSFYPTKNLAALGDGGAIITNDRALAERLRRLRNGGQTDRYHHQVLGANSRLDEIQAAVLLERLPRLHAWTAKRRDLANRYRARLGRAVDVPPECDPGHVYHLFPVRTSRRDELQAALRGAGIETLVHYPISIPKQQAFAGLDSRACPIAEHVCRQVVSLPLHPRLTEPDIDMVADAVNDAKLPGSPCGP
jgi:dTDP-4-amino-4,6-dideoxygalactose transaminase